MLSAATLESATARIRSPSGVWILDQAAKIALKIRGKTNEMSQSNRLMIQFTTHANQGQVRSTEIDSGFDCSCMAWKSQC